MKLISALLVVSPLFAQQTPFRLGPGEFRWVPITVKHIPTEIDSRFRVVSGSPSVRMELLSPGEFRLFTYGREHSPLAESPESGAGEIRRIIDQPGEYRILVVNDESARAADVSLEVRMDLNPGATELSPMRRLTVILISFGIFFVTITWSGFALLRAIRRTGTFAESYHEVSGYGPRGNPDGQNLHPSEREASDYRKELNG